MVLSSYLLQVKFAAKNGYYGSLVPMVRDAFLVSELVRIDCTGLERSDYKKIGCKLRVKIIFLLKIYFNFLCWLDWQCDTSLSDQLTSVLMLSFFPIIVKNYWCFNLAYISAFSIALWAYFFVEGYKPTIPHCLFNKPSPKWFAREKERSWVALGLCIYILCMFKVSIMGTENWWTLKCSFFSSSKRRAFLILCTCNAFQY